MYIFSHQVVQFHRERYAMVGTDGSETVQQALSWTDILPQSPDGQYYICRSNCHEKLKAAQLPNCAIANDLGLDKIPPELAKLGPLEQRLISKRFIFYKVRIYLVCKLNKLDISCLSDNPAWCWRENAEN